MRKSAVLLLIALLERGSSYSTGARSRRGVETPQTRSLALRTSSALSLYDRQSISFNVDCNKLLDQLVGYISDHPDYAAKVLGITAGTSLAYNVCRTFSFQNCHNVAGSVGSAMTVAVLAGMTVENPKTKGSQTVSSSKRRRGAAQETAHGAPLRSELESRLVGRNLVFDSISEITTLASRDIMEPASYALVIRGLMDHSGDNAADHYLTIREDGVGYTEISPRADDSVSDGLERRGSRPGFKIAWEVIEKGPGTPDHKTSDLLCGQVADDWATRAERRDMGDYVGELDLGDAGKMAFRIIPEAAGFGDDYEDVATCNKP